MSEFLTRDQARQSALFEVTAGSAKFLCRVPSVLELFADGVIAPPLLTTDMTAEEQKGAGLRAAQETYKKVHGDTKTADALLSRSMVTPALWKGAEDECPEDQVTITVLGPYRDRLLDEILPRIGYEEDRRKAVDFRDSDGDLAVAAPDGEGVRGESAPAA